MAEKMKSMGIAEEKIHLITNWANTEVVYPIPPSENLLRQKLGLDGKFVLMYSGNMGLSHYFDDLLKVIRRLRNIDGLHFVFIGEGKRRSEIEKFVISHKLTNVTLLPFQPLDRLAECLSLGDIHFVSLRKGFEGLVVPSKAYGALAAGRAVIYQGDSRGEIAQMIIDEGFGAVVNECSSSQLEKIVRTYLQSPDIAVKQGLTALRFTCNKISAYDMTERYYRIIRDVCYSES
jgi:glycosyltransferase involved in cell wall biosynthesis